MEGATCTAVDGEGENGMITVPKKQWEEIRLTLACLSKTNEEIVKGNKILRQELQNMTTRVQKLEAEAQAFHNQNEQLAPLQPKDENHTEGTGHKNLGQPQAERDTQNLSKLIVQQAGEANAGREKEMPQQNDSKGPDHKKRINWAGIMKGHRPALRAVPTAVREKIHAAQRMIYQHRICTRRKPKPKAVYFKYVRSGPIGVLRKALQKRLPGWAVMGLSFPGGSILEVITDRNLRNSLIATLKIMEIVVVTVFNIAKAAKNWDTKARGTSIE